MNKEEKIFAETLSQHEPKDNYVYVDGWTSGNPGPGGFIITNHSGNILYQKDYNESHTNNWYELAGIAAAAILFPGKVIWSDSVTAMSWAYGRMGKGARRKYADDTGLQTMLSSLRMSKPDICKWATSRWGEIPADPGRKN